MTLRADTELPIVVLNPREAPLTLVRGDQAVKLRQGSMITVGPRQYLIETSASAVSWQPQDSRLVNCACPRRALTPLTVAPDQPTPRKTRYKGTLRARLLAQLEDHDEADVPPTATLVVPSARPLARTTSVEMPPADAPMDVDDDPTQQQRNDALVFLKPDWPFGRLRILARASDVPPAILSRPHAPATFDWAIGDAHFQLDGGEAEGMRSRSPSPPRMPRPSQADLQFATQDRARFQPSSPGCSPTQLVVSQQRGVVFHGRGLGGEYMPRIIDEEGEGEEENDLDDSAIDMQAVSMALGVVPPSQPKPVIPASQPKPIIAPIVPLSQPKPVIQPAAPSSPLPLLPTKKRAKVLVKKDGGAYSTRLVALTLCQSCRLSSVDSTAVKPLPAPICRSSRPPDRAASVSAPAAAIRPRPSRAPRSSTGWTRTGRRSARSARSGRSWPRTAGITRSARARSSARIPPLSSGPTDRPLSRVSMFIALRCIAGAVHTRRSRALRAR